MEEWRVREGPRGLSRNLVPPLHVLGGVGEAVVPACSKRPTTRVVERHIPTPLAVVKAASWSAWICQGVLLSSAGPPPPPRRPPPVMIRAGRLHFGSAAGAEPAGDYGDDGRVAGGRGGEVTTRAAAAVTRR